MKPREEKKEHSGLTDTHGRRITYMRVSITDRCNLRCLYCVPKEGERLFPKEKILSYEEIVLAVSAASALGVRHVRLTGGEPLTRKNMLYLVSELRRIENIDTLSLTTNGLLLPSMARNLKSAGIDRVNISLDTLRPERYERITRGGLLAQVLSGINLALDAGLTPVKINTIPIRGFNDDEFEALAALSLDKPLHVRFIEYMPMGRTGHWDNSKVVPVREVMERLSRKFGIEPLADNSPDTRGPAKNYRLTGAQGVVGFISPLTEHFCASCGRLRLTSDGRLRPCLFSDYEESLAGILKNPAQSQEQKTEALKSIILKATHEKPKGHNLPGHECVTAPTGGYARMSELGG